MTRAILDSSRAACAVAGSATAKSPAPTASAIATPIRIRAPSRTNGCTMRDSLLSRGADDEGLDTASGAGYPTAVDRSQRRCAQGEDGHRPEREPRQREHR